MTQRLRQASNSRGTVAGWILLLLLLTAIMLGAFAVLEAAASWESKVRTNAAERQASLSVPAPSPSELEAANTPAAPEELKAPAAEEPEAPAAEEPVSPTEAVQPGTEPEPETARVTLMALGDNLLHNCVYWSAQKNDGTYDFTPFYADIQPTVESYDIACINQETIYVNDPAMYGNYPYFGSPTAVGDALAGAGFDVVTQATNHCLDKGETGILDTIQFWREKHPEITMLGIHDSQEDADTIRVVEKNGIRIAMLNYTYGLNYNAPPYAYMVDLLHGRDAIASTIARAREQADFVVVFAHWGEEGIFEPTDQQKDWAQFFANQGVDLVIGAHPHVLQPLVTLTGSDGHEMPVFYSLGNFLSHQVEPQNMLGGLASVTFEKDADGTRVTDCTLEPTINVMLVSNTTGFYDYRPMLLTDYTDELAARHHIPGCGVEAMWSLYRQVTGEG